MCRTQSIGKALGLKTQVPLNEAAKPESLVPLTCLWTSFMIEKPLMLKLLILGHFLTAEPNPNRGVKVDEFNSKGLCCMWFHTFLQGGTD